MRTWILRDEKASYAGSQQKLRMARCIRRDGASDESRLHERLALRSLSDI